MICKGSRECAGEIRSCKKTIWEKCIFIRLNTISCYDQSNTQKVIAIPFSNTDRKIICEFF